MSPAPRTPAPTSSPPARDPASPPRSPDLGGPPQTQTQRVRAVGYLRRSTDRQPLSLERQQDVLEQWAVTHHVEITRWYEDDAVSGATADERAGFQLMIRELEAAAADAAGSPSSPGSPSSARRVALVLCYDVARFGRTDNDEAGFYRHRLRAIGIEVVYVAEAGITGADTDELILPILQYQKREFLRDVSRSSIAGSIKRAQRGAWTGGPCPYGFERELRSPSGKPIRRLAHGERSMTDDGSTVHLIPSSQPLETAAVRLAWELYWVRGEGLDAVRDAIADLGARPRRVAAWRTSVIRVIVTNPVYTGRVTYGLRAVGKFYRASAEGPQARSRAQFGRYERSPAARPVVVEGAHTSLVSPEAAAAFLAWEARERERRLAGGRQQIGNRHTARAEYLLSGLIRCTGCGCKFTGQRRLRKGIEYPDYLCSGFVGSGCRVCCRFVVPGEALDEYVLGEIRAQWRGTIDPERVRVQLAEAMGLGAGDGSGGPVEPIRRQISAIEARMVTIATNLDPEHAAVANDAIKRLKVDRAALARRLEEAETRASSSRKIEDLVTRLVALLDDAPALWQAASPHRRRVLVRSFVAGIAVDPARGTVAVDFWRVPKVTTARDPLEGAASRGVGLVAGVDSSRYAPTRQVVLRVLPGRELRPAG